MLPSTRGEFIDSPEATAIKYIPLALSNVINNKTIAASSSIYRLLVGILNHPNSDVSSICRDQIANLVSNDARLSIPLLDALSDALLSVKLKLLSFSSDDISDSSTVTSYSGILRKTLRVITPLKVHEHELIAEIFPRALLLSHHPLLVYGKAKKEFSREWDSLKNRFVEFSDDDWTVHDAIDSLFESVNGLKEATKHMISSELFSGVEEARIAAFRTLATLLDFAGNGLGEHLVLHGILEEVISSRLQEYDISKVSSIDVAIYHTEEGVLFEMKKNDPISRNLAHATEEERWERQVREEIDRKRAQSGLNEGKKKLTKEEYEILSQQQAIRQRLKNAHDISVRIESALAFLSSTCPDAMQPALPFLVQPLLHLLKSAFFSEFGLQCLRHLCRCVMPANLRAYSSPIVTALKISFLASESDNILRTLSQSSDLFERVFTILSESVFGYVLESESDFEVGAEYLLIPPPTYHLIYPILHVFLENTSLYRRFVLPLFSAHARMINEEDEMEVGDMAAQRMLRCSMIKLNLSWLSQRDQNGSIYPGAILTQLCSHPPLSPEEWTPLMGDKGLLSQNSNCRRFCLQAILAMDKNDIPENTSLTCSVFLATYDEEDDVRALAIKIWDEADMKLSEQDLTTLVQLLSHSNANVRECAAAALANGLKRFREVINPTLDAARSLFMQMLPVDDLSEQYDSFGIPIIRRVNDVKVEGPDSLLPRIGVAICFEYCAREGILSRENVMDSLHFIIQNGLGDCNYDVRQHMRKAGIRLIDSYGSSYTSGLLTILETPFSSSGSSSREISAHDHQKEGIVVFMGSLAKHMDKSDPKVASIVHRLLESLKVPSETVQRAVANCLSPLVPAVKDQSTQILDELLERATKGEVYGDRMGAAFGVSAVVKGLGIAALKHHTIIPRLEEAMKNSNPNSRQGSLIVIECLCERLGFLFEPYVIVILPILLKSFADTNAHVREAASLTSKGIMRHLSAHGVKLVLPSILRAVDDTAWRTKQAAIQLLGAMASCAPKQLGSCLPQIIPKLTESLSDSHPRVKEAGHTAMNDIALVIRNPEISSISSVLLAGLQDPNRKTNEALQSLQSMVFVHSIDAPSMALIMPILQRGLMDRLSETKKKAALIVGNMCSMINDAKDLVPYLDTIAPCLQVQLLDPIPEVRTVASKALGMLVKGLGQTHFPNLVPSLLNAMKSDSSSVERSGSAQGLCEVLVALGLEPLDGYLRDEIFPIARHPKPSVREGVLWVVAFLPPALGKLFAKYLTKVLPMVVAGLSDEAEGVREVAMHAGSIVVNAHALSHTKDILPSLESGIFDDNWRIRQSSISLLGDLLYRVSGTSVNKAAYINSGDSDDEDDSIGSAAGERAMLKVLGKTRRDNVLASLYMVRSDTSAVVRQSALQVWKSVVSNTPKTLKSILETLMKSIVEALSGNNPEKQAVAGRTLGDIVRKLGERVMPEVVPILRSGLSPDNPDGMRQGVCLGLAEVIGCSPKKQLEEFVETLVDALEEALCDVNVDVRTAAAQAFDVFHKSMGYRSIDEIIPRLLKRVQSSNDETQGRALSGLQEMLRLKSREVLPYLIPRLLTTPLVYSNVQALGRIATVSGSVIHYHIDRIMAVLFSEYVVYADNEKMASAIKNSLKLIVLGVEDPGIQWLSSEMCKFCESDVVETRYLACWLVSAFCDSTTANYDQQVPIFIKYILQRFNDSDPSVVQAASQSFNSLNATIRPEELSKHIDFIRNNLNSLVSDARHRKGGVGSGEFLLPALCIPKGLDPFLPAYQFALMNGSPELRQSAANGLGELVLLANAACLKSVLIKITGPLIRIAGDRFPSHVKSAILSTLEILLVKGNVALKPFLPQLQTTFVKALHDASGAVRSRGATALVELVKLSPRVDPLVSELADRLSTSTTGIKEANLDAIIAILSAAGSKISQPVLGALQDSLRDSLNSEDDKLRAQASICIGQTLSLVLENGSAKFLDLAFEHDYQTLWTRKHSSALLCQHVLKSSSNWVDSCIPQIVSQLSFLAENDKAIVRNSALLAMLALISRDPDAFSQVLSSVIRGLLDAEKDVNRASLRVVKKMAKQAPAKMRHHLKQLVPTTFQHIKSSNISVKFAAERALLYMLEIHTRPETLAELASSTEQGKLLTEYSRRVLSKLKAGSESDDE
ncbi:Aste57867_293 [Aphanomyces stellatus]|uniref:Aste57867_293 protein n=1 Tax=Aphanomyces stellatus TaxID=120398 RepID=A0A485K282_9STRA|nr:hypothetical protein As57867_000293 [Aphanomyces stellatus]VFT77519.1 Aste57867_293 [Aphanomyces stellatus]